MPRFLRRTIRLRSHPVNDERGSVLPYLSVAAALVALVALTLMTGLGDAILHRRDASNAADAAALAAARSWADSIESTYRDALDATTPASLWSSAGKGLGSFATPGAKLAAERYASLDGATLTAYSVDTVRGTVTVSVRTKSAITGTDHHMTATSTAKIVLEDGVCQNGGQLGFKIEGKCFTQQTQSDTSEQIDTKAPPLKVSAKMSKKARISTRLVSS